MTFSERLLPFSSQPLPHQLLLSILKGYSRPNDKIHQFITQGVLEPVRKGLYIVGPALNPNRRPEPFLLANYILGPSYVSVETALSYHGLIPERVYEIASMTTKAPRKFRTPQGNFTYTRLGLPYYAFGIRTTKLAEDQYAIVASPEKALCDKIVTTSGLLFRSKKAAREFLLENMRIDEEMLKRLNTKEMSTWIQKSQKGESLSMIISAIDEL
ncbi:MAG TPA: hypothetical protein VFE50_20545 [Cyclobacteriaceae bacterium]|nr:hypothetical protein [Cyclobacteriaceae bacterium]